MIFFIISVGFIGYYKFSKIKNDLSTIFEDTMPGSSLLLEADRDLYQILVAERSLIFSNPSSDEFKQFIEDYNTNLEQVKTRFEKFVPLASLKEEKDFINEFQTSLQTWYESSAKFIELCKDTTEKSHQDAIKMSLGETAAKFEAMRNNIDKLVDISYNLSDDVNKSAVISYKSGKLLIILTVLIGTLLGIAFSLLISTGILTSVNSAIKGFKDIADGKGDLTKRMEVKSKDEVGTLALWFNTFIDKLQNDVKEISNTAGTLNESSNSLIALSSHMSIGAGELTNHAHNVAAASEEMSTNLSGIAATMEQITTGSENSATAAEEMAATVNEIARNAEIARNSSATAVEQACKASQKMESLGNNAKAIGKITDTIQDISDQINLLSLNATIEAASAGSAGRGFAVVATEIKELSKRTAKATQDIAQQIDNVQSITLETASEIQKIVAQIDNINNTVSQIATAAEEESAATKEIASIISQASSGMQEINQRVSQNSNVSQNITKDISNVSSSASSIYSGSNQLKASSDELKKMSMVLQNLVGRFKI